VADTIVADNTSSSTPEDITFIPDKASLEKTKEEKGDEFAKANNLAGDDELCQKAWSWASGNYSRYVGQEQREAWFETNNDGISVMDLADRMYRVAMRRNKSSKQHQNTLSDVSDGVFYDAVRTLSAGISTIFFGTGNELPATYEPEINTSEYTLDQGEIMAEYQNALEAFTFDEDKRVPKIKKAVKFTEKYANHVVSMEWDDEWRETLERVPDQTKGVDEETGVPKGFKRELKRRHVKSWPTFREHELKDCFFDCLIADLDDKNTLDRQRCFLVRKQWSWEDLAREQAAGRFLNVENIKPSHLFSQGNQTQEGDVVGERQTNAEEGETEGHNGLFEVWHVKGWMPIDEGKKKNGKGKWKPGAPLRYFWGTWIGRPHAKSVCARLILDPYYLIRGCSNFRMLHSEHDDKGALHDGLASRIQSLYWQIVTNENQGCDAITKIVNAPHITDGQVKKRSLTYRQNDLVKTSRGARYELLPVPDITGPIAINREHFTQRAMRLAGTDKPLTAEPLGARTSATEAKNVFDAAMMPLDEKAAYQADQLFPWMYEWDAAMWRHWADPKLKLVLTGAHNPIEVMPAQLWGPIRTKVTAVTRFHNTTVERQQINTGIQNLYPMSEQYMASDRRNEFWADIYTMMGLDGKKYFPQGGDYDATRMATNEIYSMLNGQWVEPAPDENQAVHHRIVDAAVAQYAILPNRDDNVLRMLREHREMHKQMMEQQKAGIATAQNPQQAQQAPQPALGTGGEVPQLEGNAVGDIAAGLEGAQAGGI